jgi:tetratricopeptide (TPR) repeat protein
VTGSATARRGRGPGPGARAATLAALIAVLALSGCATTATSRVSGEGATGATAGTSTPATPPATPPNAAPPAASPPAAQAASPVPPEAQEALRDATRARHYQDHGEYEAALGEWTKLREKVAPDADLELHLAIDEARSGRLDAAAARLAGPLLSAAADDSLPLARHRLYAVRREALLVNGRFDGWHWYVWRARAEVAAARGRWEEATIAARRCVAARPRNGKQWLLLAVYAGQAGHADEAREAARQAVRLDGGIPETHHLDALWAWRDGRRAEAQAGFRTAVALDSTFQPGVSGLVRSRLPGVAPDPLPGAVLTGVRTVGMLTSRAAPKVEDFTAMEQVPIVAGRSHPAVPDSIKARLADARVFLWLYVDEDGRVALSDLGVEPPAQIPTQILSELMSLLPSWRFLPARVQGRPQGMWADFHYVFPR